MLVTATYIRPVWRLSELVQCAQTFTPACTSLEPTKDKKKNMVVPKKLLEVLQHEGVVAIATQGADGRPHMVNTWNSYIQLTGDELLLVPVGGMNRTEKNVSEDNAVLLTLGSREVEGKRGLGTGFLIAGTAEFLFTGAEFEAVKNKFSWARAALKISIGRVEQTL